MASSEIENLYKNPSLEDEDELVREMSEESSIDGKEDLEKCLVGKVLTRKKVNRDAFKALIEQIWSPFGQVEVELVRDNTFMFYFANREDRNRVWLRGSWHFSNSLIALEKPENDEMAGGTIGRGGRHPSGIQRMLGIGHGIKECEDEVARKAALEGSQTKFGSWLKAPITEWSKPRSSSQANGSSSNRIETTSRAAMEKNVPKVGPLINLNAAEEVRPQCADVMCVDGPEPGVLGPPKDTTQPNSDSLPSSSNALVTLKNLGPILVNEVGRSNMSTQENLYILQGKLENTGKIPSSSSKKNSPKHKVGKSPQQLQSQGYYPPHKQSDISDQSMVEGQPCKRKVVFDPAVEESRNRGDRGFRLELYWLKEEDYRVTVDKAWSGVGGADPSKNLRAKLEGCASSLRAWSYSRFGNLRKKILEKNKEIDFLYKSCGKPGVISSIKSLERENNINYFSTNPSANDIREASKSIKARLADNMREILSSRFTVDEGVIRNDVTNARLCILNGVSSIKEFNDTNVVLIPKMKNPIELKDFLPISLCSVVYNTITKAMANKLKRVLLEIISPFQSAFVPGRQIFDNVLVAFETLYSLSRKNSVKRGSPKVQDIFLSLAAQFSSDDLRLVCMIAWAIWENRNSMLNYGKAREPTLVIELLKQYDENERAEEELVRKDLISKLKGAFGNKIVKRGLYTGITVQVADMTSGLNAVDSIVSMFFVDRYERRRLMMISMVGPISYIVALTNMFSQASSHAPSISPLESHHFGVNSTFSTFQYAKDVGN
ncbi:hypothetical protein EZV62_018681 [Acer yangbiense]|uniref:DUF4283 domain-containing protein n=1 Tax=Acer yangbiense TaxID=1000413 RepID=A0A5C7HKJ9_9ROSI|nr:hypothetical protein EZV62_018681 [Acer yangbiense]